MTVLLFFVGYPAAIGRPNGIHGPVWVGIPVCIDLDHFSGFNIHIPHIVIRIGIGDQFSVRGPIGLKVKGRVFQSIGFLVVPILIGYYQLIFPAPVRKPGNFIAFWRPHGIPVRYPGGLG